jgi:transcriptional regulator with XRE-family HTH domain
MHQSARDGIAEKIDYLFRTVRRPDGREFTYDEVEQGTDGRVSRSYVWKLRHGRNRNPSLDVIEALSEFFHVPPQYFFGADLQENEEARAAAEVAALLQDTRAREVARRARGLSPASLEAVNGLITSLRRIEMADNARNRTPVHPIVSSIGGP